MLLVECLQSGSPSNEHRVEVPASKERQEEGETGGDCQTEEEEKLGEGLGTRRKSGRRVIGLEEG